MAAALQVAAAAATTHVRVLYIYIVIVVGTTIAASAAINKQPTSSWLYEPTSKQQQLLTTNP